MRRVLALVALLVVSACSTSTDVVTIDADPVGGISGSTDPETTAPTADDSVATNPDVGTLDWSSCGAAAGELIDLESATLTVPLDYGTPAGETIEIAVARTATADADARIGSLVFNPGGPGGSGIEFLTSAASLVPPEIAERFDLVSFDPRGVGASTAIDCEADLDDDVTLLAPGDDAGWEALVAEAVDRADTCTDDSLALEPYVGTNNAARDLDELRAALGDDQLSYVGFSYGTRLGATYAELFPERVRAVVLDGAVKPTDDLARVGLEQGPGFDAALESFGAACDADVDCALADVGPTLDVYAGLVDEIADAGGFPTDDGDRILTPGELQLGVAAALYAPSCGPCSPKHSPPPPRSRTVRCCRCWPTRTWVGNPTGATTTARRQVYAINCADDPARPPIEDVRVQARAGR